MASRRRVNFGGQKHAQSAKNPEVIGLKKQVKVMQDMLKAAGLMVPEVVGASPRQNAKRGKAPVGSHSAGPAVGSPTDVGRTADGGRKADTDWVAVKVKRKEAPTASADTLVADGWSVPVLPSTDPLTNTSTGIVLANMKLGRELFGVLSAEAPLALLLPAPLAGKDSQGQLLSVLVKDKNGKMQLRSRYLYQLGSAPVVFASTAPSVQIISDTVNVVMQVDKKRVSQDVWNALQSRPVPAAKYWLAQKAAVKVLDVKPPTRIQGAPNCMQVVATISCEKNVFGNISSGLWKALGASGVDA